MAPELFEEGGCHSFSSDLWAFGILLYNLRFGRSPWRAANLQDLVAEVSSRLSVHGYSKEYDSALLTMQVQSWNASVPPVDDNGVDVSSEFRDLVTSLLARAPRQRLSW